MGFSISIGPTLCRYSMVLIGAAFFHQRYLQLFQDQPQEVHTLVDETQNCDDIAMNFVVSLHLRKGSQATGGITRSSGVFVKPVDLRNMEKDARSGYQGMWHRPEHFLQRSYCLNRLTQVYGFMPLSFSNLMVAQFGFPNYANHQSRGWRSVGYGHVGGPEEFFIFFASYSVLLPNGQHVQLILVRWLYKQLFALPFTRLKLLVYKKWKDHFDYLKLWGPF